MICGAIGAGAGAAASLIATGSAISSTLAVYVGAHLKLAALGSAGYATFEQFKKAVGRAGDGKAWHHIVEQNQTNISRFGGKAIHNLHNIVKISHGADTLHSKISGYYSSVQKFTNGMTVRQWLSSKSYEEQWKFGLDILTKFAKEMGAKIEFVE